MPLQLSCVIFDEEQIYETGTDTLRVQQNKYLKITDPLPIPGEGFTPYSTLKIPKPDKPGKITIHNNNPQVAYIIVCSTPQPREPFKGEWLKAWASKWEISHEYDGFPWCFKANYEHLNQSFLLRPSQSVQINFDASAVAPGSWGTRFEAYAVGVPCEQLVLFITVGNLNTAYPGRLTRHDQRVISKYEKLQAAHLEGATPEQMLAVIDQPDETPQAFLGQLDQIIMSLEALREAHLAKLPQPASLQEIIDNIADPEDALTFGRARRSRKSREISTARTLRSGLRRRSLSPGGSGASSTGGRRASPEALRRGGPLISRARNLARQRRGSSTTKSRSSGGSSRGSSRSTIQSLPQVGGSRAPSQSPRRPLPTLRGGRSARRTVRFSPNL